MPFALGDRLAVWAATLRPLGSVGFYGYVAGWTAHHLHRRPARRVRLRRAVPAAHRALRPRPRRRRPPGRPRLRVEHRRRHRRLARRRLRPHAAAVARRAAGGSPPRCSPRSASSPSRSPRSRACPRWSRPSSPPASRSACSSAPGPTAAWRHGSVGVGRAPASGTPNSFEEWAREQRRNTRWQRDGVESSVAHQRQVGLRLRRQRQGRRQRALRRLDAGDGGPHGRARPPRRAPRARRRPRHRLDRRLARRGADDGARRRRRARAGHPRRGAPLRAGQPRRPRQPARPRHHRRRARGRRHHARALRSHLLRAVEPVPRRHRQPVHARVLPRRRRAARATTASSCSGCRPTTSTRRPSAPSTRRLSSVFPEVETWITEESDLLLIASQAAAHLRRRAAARAHRRGAVEDGAGARLARRRSRGGVRALRRQRRLRPRIAARRGRSPQHRRLHARRVRLRARPRLPPPPVRRRASCASPPPSTATRRRASSTARSIARSSPSARVPMARRRLPARADAAAARRAHAAARRSAAVQQWEDGDFADAVAEWREQDREPDDSIARAALAESLADGGERRRAVHRRAAPGARGRGRSLRRAPAVSAASVADAGATLERAFLGAQRDPWPLPMVLSRALDLAAEIGRNDRGAAERLWRALATPFVVHLQNDRRLLRARAAGVVDRLAAAVHRVAGADGARRRRSTASSWRAGCAATKRPATSRLARRARDDLRQLRPRTSR